MLGGTLHLQLERALQVQIERMSQKCKKCFSTNFPNRLINTSELYTSSSTLHSGGTMPKMSFAPMKEEMSR